MMTFLSFIVMALVFACAVALVLWGATTAARARLLTFLGAITLAGLGFHYSGNLQVANPEWFVKSATDANMSNLPDGRCREMVAQLQKAGVVAMPAPGKITVRQDMWDMLPSTAQGVAVACLQKVFNLDDEVLRPYRTAGDSGMAE